LTELDIQFIRRIVCRFDSLTIGAPTSPLLSNSIMYDFDSYWASRSAEVGVRYTRYADDLYFSTNQANVLNRTFESLRESLNLSHRPVLRINDEKTSFSSRKRKRISAGLVLTSDRKVSIGRDKKRFIKSQVLKLTQRRLNSTEVLSLRGWIAYCLSVEPVFVSALERKYTLNFKEPGMWNRFS
jgi:RNA-directed DNA polymerase